MTYSNFTISIDIFNWAVDRSSLHEDKHIKNIQKKIEKLDSKTKVNITRNQAKQAAKKLCIPLAYFYLDSPPDDLKTPLPDFRKPQDAIDISFYSKEIINDTYYLCNWYRETLIELGNEKNPLVGQFKPDLEDIAKIAKDIRKEFGLDKIDKKIRETNKLLKTYIDIINKKNINVLVSGHYKNSTKSKIEVAEYRGFAIADSYAPIIFINSNDTKDAQIFTLFHELSHILIGESGISDNKFTNENKIEIFCNKLAAEILTPQDKVIQDFEQAYNIDEEFFLELAKKYRVSPLVIARRALDLNYINPTTYKKAQNKALDIIKQKKEKQKNSSGGPGPNIMIPIRNGNNIVNVIKSLVQSNQMQATHAMRLINANPNFLFSKD